MVIDKSDLAWILAGLSAYTLGVSTITWYFVAGYKDRKAVKIINENYELKRELKSLKDAIWLQSKNNQSIQIIQNTFEEVEREKSGTSASNLFKGSKN